MRNNFSVSIFDRLLSFISYLTVGGVGIFVLILMYFRKRTPSRFLRFNVYQAIFISLLFFVISMGFELLFKFLSYIPFLNYLVAQISFLFNRPVLFDYSAIQVFMIGLVFYMAGVSLLGRLPRVYWVSNIIDKSAG